MDCIPPAPPQRGATEYWLRVWQRARREAGRYAVETLTGLVGGSLAALVVQMALYWWWSGWDSARGYAVPILVISVAVFLCSFGFLFWRLIRLPPIMEAEMQVAHVALLTRVQSLHAAQHQELEIAKAALEEQTDRETLVADLNEIAIRGRELCKAFRSGTLTGTQLELGYDWLNAWTLILYEVLHDHGKDHQFTAINTVTSIKGMLGMSRSLLN